MNSDQIKELLAEHFQNKIEHYSANNWKRDKKFQDHENVVRQFSNKKQPSLVVLVIESATGIKIEEIGQLQNNVKLNPNQLYFKLYPKMEEFDGERVFAITPKIFFDQNGYLSDNSFDEIQRQLPPGFVELQSAIYQYHGDPQDGKRKLAAAGFIENKNLP